MNKTQILYQQAKNYIPGGTQLLSKRPERFCPETWPPYYQKAKGVRVWDLDDREYIDMSLMGVGSCTLGYADDDVDVAVKQAIDAGSMSTLNCPEELMLAETLCEIHPWAQMVRFAKTGGEAMAIASRIARTRTGKDIVLCCGYHGWHDWYLAANLSDNQALDGHLLPGLAPKGVPRALNKSIFTFYFNDTEGFLKLLQQHQGQIAAVIMEPIRKHEPKKEFLQTIRQKTQELGIVLIFDEVSSGWRLCLGGAHLNFGVNPDLAVFAKGMSNGYPMAAVIGRKEVMQAAGESFISSTYWTERVGLVAALATIRKMKEKNVAAHLCAIGREVKQGWKRLADQHGLKIDVAGMDSLSQFSFQYPNAQAVRTRFIQLMLDKDFLAINGLYVSFAHDEVCVKKYLTAVDHVFAQLVAELRQGNLEEKLGGKIGEVDFGRLT